MASLGGSEMGESGKVYGPLLGIGCTKIEDGYRSVNRIVGHRIVGRVGG
jgi:hypothetical protein